MGDLIAQGAFSKVFRGKWRGNPVAVKRVMASEDFPRNMENEIQIMKHIGSYPTIIHFYGYTVSSEGANLIQELAPYGALSNILYDEAVLPDPIPIQLTLAW